MNPLIFIYEDQLRDLISSNQTNPIGAVSFEWKGEDVYHIYTKQPQVVATGYPSFAFFKICYSQDEFDFSDSNFHQVAELFFNENSISHKNVIGIFLFLNSNKLEKKAFRKTVDGISVCDLKYVPAKSELYSRSKGLLETGSLESKTALIIGLGSFGSQISVELAKAGIGNYDLVDFDRVELSNISRHICGVNELGRLKTRAVRDAILVKNPYANVRTHEIDINAELNQLKELISKTDIVLCLTDNNRSRFNVNEIAHSLNKTVIYGRAITRAEGGDIFVLKGNASPCYCCLINENGGVKFGGEEEISSIKQVNSNLPAYTSQNDKEAAIQVGLSSDIQPICNMIVKLTLVELSKGLNTGITSLAQELTYDYYFWANRREKNYLNFQPFNNSKLQPTILKWFGVNVPPNPECFICQSNKILS
jgi:molybdopterin/thiamine biosynthesis adenylyltransferase